MASPNPAARSGSNGSSRPLDDHGHIALALLRTVWLGKYVYDLFMAPFPQALEPPQIPGRFSGDPSAQREDRPLEPVAGLHAVPKV
jgi:hypothetical protein